MEPQSYSSNLNDDDLIEFSEDTLIKVGKLRKALKQVSREEVEKFVQKFLRSQGIKTYPVTEIYQPNREKIEHTNKWLSNGVACRFLKLGNQQWSQGKIKLKVEIEFESNEPSSI